MISFMLEISSAKLVLCCSILDLFVLQTFIKSMPQEAKRENLEEEQASGPASEPRKSMFGRKQIKI